MNIWKWKCTSGHTGTSTVQSAACPFCLEPFVVHQRFDYVTMTSHDLITGEKFDVLGELAKVEESQRLVTGGVRHLLATGSKMPQKGPQPVPQPRKSRSRK